jgi:hypothetical protein
MIGDFVNYLPGNVQDLSLPGSRAAFAQDYTVLGQEDDWQFIQSLGTEAGRFDMSGPLPGRYYGIPWYPPGSFSFAQANGGPSSGWLAPNSGVAFDPGSSILSDVGVIGPGSPAMGPAAAIPPASSIAAAAGSGLPLGPVTLTTPMPSVLQPRANQVTASQLQPCGLAQWVNKNPLLAVGGAVAVYLMLRGGK